MKPLFVLAIIGIAAGAIAQGIIEDDSTVCYMGNHVYTTKTVHDYDTNGNLINELYLEHNGSDWVKDKQTIFIYDSIPKLVATIFQKWMNNSWENDRLHLISYDSAGNHMNMLYQQWSGTEWYNIQLYTYTDDSAGNRSGSLLQSWQNTAWENERQFLYTYDSIGNQISALMQTWDGTNWENEQLFSNSFSGNTTIAITQNWIGTGWRNLNRDSIVFDANANMIYTLSQSWDNSDSSWQNQGQTVQEYNTDGNLTSSIYSVPSFDTFWAVTSQYFFTYVNGKLTTTHQQMNYHEAGYFLFDQWCNVSYYQITGIEPPGASEPLQATVYPNPFKESVTIALSKAGFGSSANITLYNMFGQLVANSQITEPTFVLGRNDLPSGIYFYRISSGEKTISTGKLVAE